ncbi:MAG: hypothetical protein M1829_004579 [Trizodia sp. TS-e1964]|nr:MAG: hypothetical protein M1829_004579 [Trizodia sp. TS-e1964]
MSAVRDTDRPDALDPIWDNMERAVGQLFIMGFEGTAVTPQIRCLIRDHHLGSILLTTKNLKSAEESTRLVHELQSIAHGAGHPTPLLIALGQENGGVNSLFDEHNIRQFPSAMGLAATGCYKMAYEVARATAREISSIGVNWIMGPVLDVLTNVRSPPLGVRTTGDDPQEVSHYGEAFMKGYQAGGVVTCGKHFPSYGHLEFRGSPADEPTIADIAEQLSPGALIPFRNAITQGLDAIMVGGCAMTSPKINVKHVCLSERVVEELLRHQMGFAGVVVSECLEMESISYSIGVGNGTLMAVEAGCDLVLICRSHSVQEEALSGLKLGLNNGTMSPERIHKSLRRVLKMKSKCTSWDVALAPPGMPLLSSLQLSHTLLSEKSYNSSITVVRDNNHLLPIANIIEPDEELLVLSPLVKPLPTSAAPGTITNENSHDSDRSWETGSSIMSGEGVFQEFGRSLAERRKGRVLHTSYTANGVRPDHEKLISRAAAVIVLTADATRNLYQNGFTKHISMICNSQLSGAGEKREKPLIVVAVSSPYDFATDLSIGTYICTYDFTKTALRALVKVLCGDLSPRGTLPGKAKQSQKSHQSREQWLVEDWNEQRDANSLSATTSSSIESFQHLFFGGGYG